MSGCPRHLASGPERKDAMLVKVTLRLHEAFDFLPGPFASAIVHPFVNR